ncbi:MAG: 50S ribosomal protein L10 [Gemmatimonadetes bacterium]|nr:50S ribosomal protein L10 [Gemmatimonadota bacterium]
MATATKVELVADLAERFKSAEGVVLADFTGLTVEKITELRRACLKGESQFYVVKNTLAKRALKEAGITGLDEYLQGPTGWAITEVDAVAPAKVLSDFAKENKLPKIKAGYIDGSVLDAAGVGQIADLPPKPVLMAQIAGLINAPVTGIAAGLNAVMQGLAVGLDEVRKQKEAGGGTTSSSNDSADDADAGASSAAEDAAAPEETKEAEAPAAPEKDAAE